MGEFQRSYDLAILLGAGASFDADIPHSRSMIEDIQTRVLGDDQKWNRFREIYNCVRSGTIFHEGSMDDLTALKATTLKCWLTP